MENNLEVAVVKYLCPICGQVAEEGIIMNSLLTAEIADKVKSLHNKIVGFANHACKNCAKYDGIYIVGIDVTKSSTNNPYRTGNIVCIRKSSELATHLRNHIETLEDGSKYCYLSDEIGKSIGLWE